MIRPINHSRKDYYLLLNGITSKNPYQDLFDYDQQLNQNSLTFKQEIPLKTKYFLILRNKKTSKIRIQTKKQLNHINSKDILNNETIICAGKTGLKDKNFHLKLFQPYHFFDQYLTQNVKGMQKSFGQNFIVVRSLKNQQKQTIGYQIKKNQIIKLGSSQFYVHSICYDNQNNLYQSQSNNQQNFLINQHVQNLSQNDENQQFQNSTKNMADQHFFTKNNQMIYDASLQNIENPQAQCKYCMMPESSQKGQFLCSPCKCSGSCRLVHFNCLVKWNQNKVKKTQNKGCIQYNFEKFFCEVCKSQYPQYIRKDNILYELLPIQKPKGQYVILQVLKSSKRNIVILNNFSHQGLVIGRGHECNLKIQDDSTVSRRHAIIKKMGRNLMLFDLKSKFGTLIKDSKANFPLKKNVKFSIQSGSSIISFNLIKRSSQNMFQS